MKNFTSIILVVMVLLVNSCAITQEELWNFSYQEKFTEFFVDEHNNQIVLVGKKYEYHIDDDKELSKAMLFLNGNKNIEATIGIYQVDKFNYRGDISFVAKRDDLSENTVKFIENFKNAKFRNKKGELLMYVQVSFNDLKVERSLKNQTKYKKVNLIIFKNDFEDQIVEKPTVLKTTEKILLTPFAIAADILMAPFYLIGIIGAGVGSN